MARIKQTARKKPVQTRLRFTAAQKLNASIAYCDFHNIDFDNSVLPFVEASAAGVGGWARDYIRIVRKTVVFSRLFQSLSDLPIECIFDYVRKDPPKDSRFN